MGALQDNRTLGPNGTQGNVRFPDMRALAADMQRLSVKPGLWFRPLTTRASVPENCLLKRPREQSGRSTPRSKARPNRSEATRAAVRLGIPTPQTRFSTYDLLGRWGFQMAAELTDANWHFADRTRTNAEIFRALYALLREAAGATPLLGCNTVGHSATGLFEVQRTGDDTSGRDWSRTRKMGVNTLAFRAAQQGALFDVDADCVGLTKAIPWSLNRQWLDLLSRSGTPLFVSAAPDAVGPEQRSALSRSFRPRRHAPTRLRAARLARNKRARPLALGKLDRRYDWFTDALSIPL